jgi:thiol-disulfide isomerase/thioredoxin
MWRAMLSLAFLASCAWVSAAQDSSQPSEREKTLLEDVKKNPDDVAALRAYLNATMSGIARNMNTDPAAALKAADAFEAAAKSLKPETPAAKALVANMTSIADAYRNHIRAMQSPFGDLVKQLTEIAQLSNREPKEAGGKLDALKAAVEKAAASDAGKEHKAVLDYLTASISQIERPLAASRKLTEMIGKPAAPLKIEAWVNGSPLTDNDLKGKVVLLDFWAVWCGPCIATFPHLREWHEKYADKGFVIIGLTGYYNFKWDEDAGKAMRAENEVPKTEEREMLAKFAKSHDLAHRFAVTADDSLSEYYGVSGIPHVVVIDREGTVRMMKVGSGDETAAAIEEMLEKLIAAK